jgi:hypothetical protein
MMKYDHWWIVLLLVIQLPLMAMDIHTKRVHDGIYEIIAGTEDGEAGIYKRGLVNILKRQKNLKNMTFQSLRLNSAHEQAFLKALVINKEKELLSTFIEMYCRSYPSAGLNFTYAANRSKKIPKHTLLDVALTAFGVAEEQQKSGEIELEIVNFLAHKGAKIKFYNLKPKPPINKPAAKTYVCSKTPQESPAPEVIILGPIASPDVGPLLEPYMGELGQDIELETGIAVSFDLGDSK